jgi:hypothetical protein
MLRKHELVLFIFNHQIPQLVSCFFHEMVLNFDRASGNQTWLEFSPFTSMIFKEIPMVDDRLMVESH